MQVCTCECPRIKLGGDKNESYCEICGHWWMPKYGSKQPKPNKSLMDAVMAHGK